MQEENQNPQETTFASALKKNNYSESQDVADKTEDNNETVKKASENSTEDEILKAKLEKSFVKDGEVQTLRTRKLGDLFTGRRKTSIARVKLLKGTGKATINKRDMSLYFNRKMLQSRVIEPLKLLNLSDQYDLFVNVKGGGPTGQAEAIRMGIARCLSVVEPNSHQKLREAGFLTRDSRMVERKKFGLHKARRAVQFSKR